jgi:hypothetical protein
MNRLRRWYCRLFGHRNPARFEPNGNGLYHARCERCGAVIDLDKLHSWFES